MRLTRWNSVPTAQRVPGSAASSVRMMNSVEPARSAGRRPPSSTRGARGSSWVARPAPERRVRVADLVAVLGAEELVHRAVPRPQDDAASTRSARGSSPPTPSPLRRELGVVDARRSATSTPNLCAVLRPRCWSGRKRILISSPSAFGRVAPVHRPLEDRSALELVQHAPAVRADEGLDRRRRVHIGDRDDPPVPFAPVLRPVLLVEHRVDLVPRVDGVLVGGHVRHRAPGSRGRAG
jgi:hypothetical protein